jgi:hypothetical protein
MPWPRAPSITRGLYSPLVVPAPGLSSPCKMPSSMPAEVDPLDWLRRYSPLNVKLVSTSPAGPKVIFRSWVPSVSCQTSIR